MKAKVIIATILILTAVAGATYYWFAKNPEAKQKYLGAVTKVFQKEKQPSEKALRIAAFMVARAPNEKVREAVGMKYGAENPKKATDVIRALALAMDNDPAEMAFFEAQMQKTMAEEGQSSSNYYYEQPSYEQPSTPQQVIYPSSEEESVFDKAMRESEERKQEQKQECQQKWTEYNSCLSEYNAEVAEYSLCMSRPNLSSKYICGFEPHNSCFKPFCSL